MQAGCAFHANELQQRAPGVAYLVTCPPGCAAAGGTVWGSGPYTADSAMCMSAVHSGAISDQGGSFQVVMDQGQPAYRGSVQNNVPSTDYGSYGESYWIRMPDGSPPPAASAAPTAGPQVAQVGCSFRANELQDHQPGMRYGVACPPGCGNNGTVWGTDMYTADSPVCSAAIHAGLIGPQGGQFTVTIQPGQPAYRGSQRNGVHTNDYGSYGEGYTVSP